MQTADMTPEQQALSDRMARLTLMAELGAINEPWAAGMLATEMAKEAPRPAECPDALSH